MPFLYIFFSGLECVGHSFAYAAHFIFLRDIWIRTQRAAVASRRGTNLTTRLPLSHPSPYVAAHLSNENVDTKMESQFLNKRMTSIQVVGASDCQCQSRNTPGFLLTPAPFDTVESEGRQMKQC
jgi:hypothetical protein